MILARQRQDLLDQDLLIPYTLTRGGEKVGASAYTRLDKWIEGDQDDNEDGEFYTNFGIFNTIDLEFKETYGI